MFGTGFDLGGVRATYLPVLRVAVSGDNPDEDIVFTGFTTFMSMDECGMAWNRDLTYGIGTSLISVRRGLPKATTSFIVFDIA